MPIKSASRYVAGAVMSCALVLGATACNSKNPSATAGSAPATTATPTSSVPSITGKPGCDDAIAAFRDATSNMASKVRDLPSLQAFVTNLVARLHSAAANINDPAVQSAVNKLADDFNSLVTAAQTSNGSQIQTTMSAFATDGQAIIRACS